MTLRKLPQAIEAAGLSQEALFDLIDNLTTVTAQLQAARIVDLALINQLRRNALYGVLSNPGFVISTNFDVKNGNAVSYVNGGTLKTLSANTNFDTGTTATIATTKWNAGLLKVDSSGTASIAWATASAAAYATEALAIAALPAAGATDTQLGYVTIQAAGITWTPGTDALQSGTGGTPATTTTYYNSINSNGAYIAAALAALAETDIPTLSKG